MPFIINEDDALKEHLQGLIVTDQRSNSRKVGVWYRLPESEERRVTYPFVTIDLIDIEEETDRAHRGRITLDYVPEGYQAPVLDSNHRTEFPIPVSLIYQITTHSRSAWHDRALHSQMLTDKLPFRFGSLDVPADDTVRRLDLLGWDQADLLDNDGKRVFRKAYTVAVSSELLPDAIAEVPKVKSVDISLFHQLEPYIVDETLVP